MILEIIAVYRSPTYGKSLICRPYKNIFVQIDKTTLHDLSFLKGQESVFTLLNRCSSQDGASFLFKIIQEPPATFKGLKEQQSAVRFWMDNLDAWPQIISNGTLVMIRKFYESADGAPEKPNNFNLMLSTVMQKIFNKDIYSFVRFSIAHLIDFLKGIHELTQLQNKKTPATISKVLTEFEKALELPLIQMLLKADQNSPQKYLLNLSYRARREIKHLVLKLMQQYAFLDALQSMARATKEHGWVFPEIYPSGEMKYEAEELFHPLLKKPVPYSLSFSKEKHFLFLTGANMSGKSTLIRSLGVAALLAHIGMGVPAKKMSISFLEGIITNMQVEDNIFLGESYFFAEVQRMKSTAEKLQKSQFHLVLMDELFKGTNVHDAYECSNAVIQGLLCQNQNIMALSTHLNELSTDLVMQKAVFFKYCHTKISDDGHYEFSYQLKDGVSQDRIGFLVLKNEGVLDLLKKKD